MLKITAIGNLTNDVELKVSETISAIWMCVPQRDMPSRFVITTSFWPTPFTEGVGNVPFCRIAAPS